VDTGALGFAVANLTPVSPQVLAASINHQNGVPLSSFGLNASDKRDQED